MIIRLDSTVIADTIGEYKADDACINKLFKTDERDIMKLLEVLTVTCTIGAAIVMLVLVGIVIMLGIGCGL